MKYIDRPIGPFIDRKEKDSTIESIDVLMATLDAENFLEKSLYSIYREIPVKRLIICDGGSKDSTSEILKIFPRVEFHIKPEIRTTGKVLEFLISKVESDWFVIVDSDIELAPGWYDEMKNDKNYDVKESGFRISAYHFYRKDENKLNQNSRASDMCHLIRTTSVKDYHCEDDHMWRYTDYFLRQVVEKAGFKYGKINTIPHIHNETERIAYESDKEKNFRKILWSEPKWIIIDEKKKQLYDIKHAKAVVKYLDPDFHLIKNQKSLDPLVAKLDKNWIMENGIKWLPRFKRANSLGFKIKNFIYRKLVSKQKN